mgnify:CR=1 FL=1
MHKSWNEENSNSKWVERGYDSYIWKIFKLVVILIFNRKTNEVPRVCGFIEPDSQNNSYEAYLTLCGLALICLKCYKMFMNVINSHYYILFPGGFGGTNCSFRLQCKWCLFKSNMLWWRINIECLSTSNPVIIFT